jgi:ribulose-phosphate 3-epimerase
VFHNVISNLVFLLRLNPSSTISFRAAAAWREAGPFNFHIEVDGGINVKTAAEAVRSGANLLVAGTSVFRAQDAAEEIRLLRNA